MKIEHSICMLVLLGMPSLLPAAPAAKEIPKAKKIIVFSPHPDDDVLGCGGAIIAHVRNNAKVTVVYMTSGESYTGKVVPDHAKLREEEAKKGMALMNVTDLIFLREPDGRLKKTNELVEKIADILIKNETELVYVPHKYDSHNDHKTTYFVVTDAIRFAQLNSTWRLSYLLCYEVWTPLSIFTHGINISKDIDLKISALAQHVSQINNKDYVSAIHGLNRYRGVMGNFGTHAECFQTNKV